MKYKIDNIYYDVLIERKNNKNTYIRVREDLSIFVTTNHYVTDRQINNLLDQNQDYLRKVLSKRVKQFEKNDQFYFLGQEYDIIVVPTIDNVDFDDNKIFIKNKAFLDNWLKKETANIFNKLFILEIEKFTHKIRTPILKIRNMKTRWGVYNKKNHSITLNSRLIEYKEEVICYVIIHELSHIIHFNHSRSFWNLVEENCPNYKKIKKILKE